MTADPPDFKFPRYDPNADQFAGWDEDQAEERRKLEAAAKPQMKNYEDEDNERMPDYEDEDHKTRHPSAKHNDEGGDVHVNKLRPVKKPFQLKAFSDIKKTTAPMYLIKGMVPRVGLVVIWGPPKCGKSFLTFDLVMHIALGWKYRGRRVQKGAVIYLALEGGQGFANRVEAWRERHLANHQGNVPFWLLDVPVDLIVDHPRLVAAIKAKLGDVKPVAVAIDTLNRALIGDENKSDDMAKFIRAADIIRVEFDCAVIIVHHCGIAANRPRGHTSLSGADDAQIAVERDEATGIITAKVEHMKDAEVSAPMASRLERVELGTDDDGELISSCVVVEAEGKAVAPNLTAMQKLALDQLRELSVGSAVHKAGHLHIPAGVRPISKKLWQTYFHNKHPSDEPDTTRKAFVRAVERLQELHLVGLWDDQAWLSDIPDMTGH
jgi:hypothetical protein